MLESVFGVKGDGRMVGSVRRFGGGEEEEAWMGELMDRAVAGLCVPLKVSGVGLDVACCLLLRLFLFYCSWTANAYDFGWRVYV